MGKRAPVGERCAPSLELGPVQSPLMMLEHIPTASPAPCSPWRRSDQPGSQGAGTGIAAPPSWIVGYGATFYAATLCMCSCNAIAMPLACVLDVWHVHDVRWKSQKCALDVGPARTMEAMLVGWGARMAASCLYCPLRTRALCTLFGGWFG